MDFRLVPFTITNGFSSISEITTIIKDNFKNSKEEFERIKSISAMDYSTQEKIKDEKCDLNTEFSNVLHGISNYNILSDEIIYFKFHSELENDSKGLPALYRRYDEHRTRVKLPPKFSKPFILIIKELSKGLLLAPWGSRARVDYIINNDLTTLLPFTYDSDITITSENIENFLSVQPDNGNCTIVSINWLYGMVSDEGSTRIYGTRIENVEDLSHLEAIKRKYNSFSYKSLQSRVKYTSDDEVKYAKIILSSADNDAPIKTSLDSNSHVSQRDFYKLIGRLIE